MTPTPPASDRHQPFVDREILDILRVFVLYRAYAAPLLLLLAVVVSWLDPTPWRVAVLAAIAVSGITAARVSAVRMRRAGPSQVLLPINLLAVALFQLGVVTVTGALESPLLPALAVMAAAGAMLGGRGRVAAWLIGTQLTILTILTVAHISGLADPLPIRSLTGDGRTTAGLLIQAFVILVVVASAGTLGVAVRGRIEAMIARALAARDDELHTWMSYSRDLETLSAEIAHELKNPLASIKGLAALVARDLPDPTRPEATPTPRTAERLAVLRAEVDRMQGILEELLAFSRPLLPLTTQDLSLRDVCRHVVEMYEATAHARGVSLVLAADDATVHGDRRKLVQVLINLVQNAVDAAPAGSTVELAVRATTDGAAIEVSDRGPGVSPELAERIFDPGVTTKAQGSGLGLPIARALARRHGGDLTLSPRSGGGTTARLSLPNSPPIMEGGPDARPGGG